MIRARVRIRVIFLITPEFSKTGLVNVSYGSGGLISAQVSVIGLEFLAGLVSSSTQGKGEEQKNDDNSPEEKISDSPLLVVGDPNQKRRYSQTDVQGKKPAVSPFEVAVAEIFIFTVGVGQFSAGNDETG